MKFLNLFILMFLGFITSNLSAQTTRQIEDDLLKSFKRIDYWDQQRSKDTTMAWSDSLEKANVVFGKKLKEYAQKYPPTITYPFNSLVKEHLNIISSTDGLFRIYSWDTDGGGTMHEFENVMQYKIGQKTYSAWVRDTAVDHQDKYVPYYTKIYVFKVNNKTYYLGIYEGVYCTSCRGQGLQVFTIENGKLNDDLKIIKTQTGLHSQLYYEYNFFYVIHRKADSLMHFDSATKTIYVPVVIEKEKVTKRYITYKFTGQYFERVKN